jgi:hypothetical protein
VLIEVFQYRLDLFGNNHYFFWQQSVAEVLFDMFTTRNLKVGNLTPRAKPLENQSITRAIPRFGSNKQSLVLSVGIQAPTV